jgi:fumarate reductase subunit D
MHLNVILPPTPRSSQWSLPFGLPNQNSVNTSPLPMLATCPAHIILLDLIALRIFGEEYRLDKGNHSVTLKIQTGYVIGFLYRYL